MRGLEIAQAKQGNKEARSPPHAWLRNQRIRPPPFSLCSPPHAWLRNSARFVSIASHSSPPHAWLRKTKDKKFATTACSPPHAWLRNQRIRPPHFHCVHHHMRGLETRLVLCL